MRANKAIVLLATLSVARVFASTPEPAILLLLPFHNATGRSDTAPLEKGFPDLVAAYLVPSSDKVQVVERDRLETLMAEQALDWEHLKKDEKSQTRLGQMLQARYLLKGSVMGSSGKWQVQAFLYETETLRLVKALGAAPASSVNQQAASVAAAVARYFSAELKPLPSIPSEADPEKSRQMVLGLGYYHQGQFARAFPEFMKILAKTPEDADARYWLGKSFFGAGLKEQARLEFRQFVDRSAKDPRVPEVKGLLEKKVP